MREKIKPLTWGILSLFLIVILISNVSAITASIGGGRIILYPSTGESIERNILVRNVNDVPININITVTGDLADNVKLNENNFKLEAEEEKKVYFTIRADKEGQTETKINIVFNPEVGKGVGLAATIIVIASGNDASSDDSNNDASTDNNAIINKDNTKANSSSNGITFGSKGGGTLPSTGKALNISPLNLLMISTAILIIILIILIVIAARKKSMIIAKSSEQQKKEKLNLKKRLKESHE